MLSVIVAATIIQRLLYCAVPTETVIVVGDAHLGQVPASVAEAFRAFLLEVPRPGDHLIINGDLFDFWFEYRSVIPRHAFPTLAALDHTRRRDVRVTLIGGNHDRWGGSFWERELGLAFHARAADLSLAGWRAQVAHGDGIADPLPVSHLLHAITHHAWTARLYGLLHPDLGSWLVRHLSRGVAEQTRDERTLARAAALQETYARELLGRRAELDLVVLGHTHRPALAAVAARRWYLNPGAWMNDRSYAVITADGPSLRQFPG